MRSLMKVVHEEGFGRAAVNLRQLARKYGVSSLTEMVRKHDLGRAQHKPLEFSANIVTGGLAALGGNVWVTLNSDGSVRWRGAMQNTGIDSYNYGISAILRAPSGRSLALAHADSIPNRVPVVGQVIRRTWDETVPQNALLAATLAEYNGARLETNLEYASGIGDALESAIAWLVKFGVGSVLGPGIGAVLFIGTEVGSLIATGSLVPGARIVGNVLWLAGPANTLFALAAEGIAALGSKTQMVSQEAYDWANNQVFGGTLPPREKLVHTDTIGGGNRAFTFPRFDGKITLNMGPDGWPDPLAYHVDRSRKPSYTTSVPVQRGEVFIHELVHACQIHHASTDLSLLADALSSKVCEAAGDDPYSYGPPGAEFASFNLEQQAQIVSDWFAGVAPTSGDPVTKARDRESPYFRYIRDNVWIRRY